jgi:hypothetical protein
MCWHSPAAEERLTWFAALGRLAYRLSLRQSGETRRAKTAQTGFVGTMSTRSPLQAARRPTPTLRQRIINMDAVERVELRNRMHDVVVHSLSDEGVLSYDQITVIGRAIMGAADILLARLTSSDQPKETAP